MKRPRGQLTAAQINEYSMPSRRACILGEAAVDSCSGETVSRALAYDPIWRTTHFAVHASGYLVKRQAALAGLMG